MTRRGRRAESVTLRTEEEIALLREANQVVADVLATLSEMVAPGVCVRDLDRQAEAMIRGAGGTPSFLGYMGYPASTCISVDEVIVHGIPNGRVLQEGEIVSMDVGVYLNGYHGDAAVTVACGEVSEEKRALMRVTDLALARAITAAAAGNHLCDIGRAVQQTCEAAGFSVVRSFVGHGIGKEMHEPPQVPNFDFGRRGMELRAGMVIAIEPMVNAGVHEAVVLEDGWTAVTKDGRPSAHFEHSIVVREHGGEILSKTPRKTWGVDLTVMR